MFLCIHFSGVSSKTAIELSIQEVHFCLSLQEKISFQLLVKDLHLVKQSQQSGPPVIILIL
jgi:hypothetical protein